MSKLLSVVVSVYNEEGGSGTVFIKWRERFLTILTGDYELLFVNDGSRDKSFQILTELAGRDRHVKVVSFSRNFGHEAAMIAGIDHSRGSAIICMDADLQHPPRCIPQILDQLEQGFDVVNMVRTKNESAGWFKNLASFFFL